MEYVILGLLIVVIILVICLLFKKNNNNDTIERMGKLETTVVRELGDYSININKSLNQEFTDLNERLDNRIRLLNDKVNSRLDENFEKTNKTFTSVLERLSKIDEAQKKIDGLSNDIVSLQGILTDKKTRGIFGEVNLHQILSSVFGENNKVYKMQYPLENGTIVD